MSNGNIRFAAAFLAGVAVYGGGDHLYENRAVGCLVDDLNKVFLIEADGDTYYEARHVNTVEGTCEPLSFDMIKGAVPIVDTQGYMAPNVRPLPAGFSFDN